MKTKILTLMALLFASMALVTSCQKEEDKAFDYPMETVYGTWNGTHIYIDDEWIDITKFPYKEFGFSIKFNADGTYSASGYFGNGNGTYNAYSNTIVTYVSGEEYARYIVRKMTSSTAELTMQMGEGSLEIKVAKQ